ncbi:MAG: GNAT family N-acetyltransferase [Spirochaetales bacterium]|jgi:GNAT superfamily N-acetyltransferase|nr:GNAT family N-acetyltransferase [Spirochaetales bacterium]
MLKDLADTALKDRNIMQVVRIEGPDDEWKNRLLPFFGHKGEKWRWQIDRTLTGGTEPLRSVYYAGLIEGGLAGTVCTFTYAGAGVFGHVYTDPNYRQKGVSSAILRIAMDDTRDLGIHALFLTTDRPGHARTMYEKEGFSPLNEFCREMAWYRDGELSFEKNFFAKADSSIRKLDWRDWGALSALMCQPRGSRLRLVSLGVYGRMSMEKSFLALEQRIEQEYDALAFVLESEATGAAAGTAMLLADKRFPGNTLLDLFVHPNYSDQTGGLIETLLSTTLYERIQAYSDPDDVEKIRALENAGFHLSAVLEKQITLPTGSLDVLLYTRE